MNDPFETPGLRETLAEAMRTANGNVHEVVKVIADLCRGQADDEDLVADRPGKAETFRRLAKDLDRAADRAVGLIEIR
jgi:hypothetical protein